MINSTTSFIERANEIHNNKYTYDKCDYKNARERVIVTCPVHGDFLIVPNNHVHCNNGCKECKSDWASKRMGDFIAKSKIVHGDKYDYSSTNYQRSQRKVVIICPEHGSFLQTPNCHLAGKGCSLCGWLNHEGTYASISKYNPLIKVSLYLIRCSSSVETFYKLGITKDIRKRCHDIPYKCELIWSINGTIGNVYPLEQIIHKRLRKEKSSYLPSVKFGGYTECFKVYSGT